MILLFRAPTTCTWDYTTPNEWGTICNGAYPTCATGRQQSPISITTASATPDVNLVTQMTFPSLYATSYNRSGGADIEIANPANEPSLFGGPLGGFHYVNKVSFRAPSEHAFDNFRASASAQFWFRNLKGNATYVLSLLFIDNTDKPNVWLDTVLSAMKSNSSKIDLNPKSYLPEDLTYYFYAGSETTPPCSQGWTWMILRNPVNATFAQIAALRAWQGVDHIRPLQPLNGRNITLEYSSIIVQEDPNTFLALLTVCGLLLIVGCVVAFLIHRQASAEIATRNAEREAYVRKREHQ